MNSGRNVHGTLALKWLKPPTSPIHTRPLVLLSDGRLDKQSTLQPISVAVFQPLFFAPRANITLFWSWLRMHGAEQEKKVREVLTSR